MKSTLENKIQYREIVFIIFLTVYDFCLGPE